MVHPKRKGLGINNILVDSREIYEGGYPDML